MIIQLCFFFLMPIFVRVILITFEVSGTDKPNNIDEVAPNPLQKMPFAEKFRCNELIEIKQNKNLPRSVLG